jgi:bifunctional isochorismate lyase/aryl carrier protein
LVILFANHPGGLVSVIVTLLMIFVTGHRSNGRYDQYRLKMLRKEAYFTPDTLADVSHEMVVQCQSLSQRGRRRFDPAGSALLVLDMQHYFLEPDSHAFIPSAPAIVPGLVRLAQAFASRGRLVIFTRHTNTTQDAGQMAVWWKDLIAPQNPTSAIIPEFNLSGGPVIEKHQYDAFYDSPLDAILTARQVKQVVIGGVMTHLCCETTGRSAFGRGYQVFFLADGTATYNQQFHQASLLNLAHGFAAITQVSDILAALDRAD